MKARPLFVGGTSSNAGKSWMVTAICAFLRGKGVAVAPFKAQNMSNNSYPCRAGGEIGRAQVAQAEACGLDPEPAMNPILLKPGGDGLSQVVVNGRVWKTLSAREYYAHAPDLRSTVIDAYEDLARRFEVVVIEGAGSVTELNLRDHDLVNLGLVTRIGAPWILVADIERGGVFASVVGTVHLLTPGERALFRGFAINKFRGDVSLFDDGVSLLEARTGARCLGVFPYAGDVHLDAEDSLSLDTRPRTPAPAGARLAIVRLTRDTRLRWMQSVVKCTHYVAGASEQDYLRKEDAPEITYVVRETIDRGAVTGSVRLHHSARNQKHDRRSRVASADGTRRLGRGPASVRCDGRRRMRRLPDARPRGVRSCWRRIVAP